MGVSPSQHTHGDKMTTPRSTFGFSLVLMKTKIEAMR